MLNYLDTNMLVAVFMAVAVGSYFIGSLMDGVLEGDGFGKIGNMMILIAGAFLGFFLIEYIIPFGRSSVQVAVAGVSGGFLTLAFLSITKAILNKFGF